MLLHPHPFLVSLGVPPSLASVACSETASFINAAHTQLQAQTLNSWSEFRPQLTLLLFVSVCLSLSLSPWVSSHLTSRTLFLPISRHFGVGR